MKSADRSVKLVFPGNGFDQLRSDLLQHSPEESSAVLFCYPHTVGEQIRLLVRDIVFPDASDYTQKGKTGVQLSPVFVARVLKLARNEGLSLIFVHTHPFSEVPQFSMVDDEGERVLMPALYARAPEGHHGALVLGTRGFEGRITSRKLTKTLNISAIVQVGSQLSVTYPDGTDETGFAPHDERHSRNVLALGAEGQSRLRSLSVGIVGVGGTGSIVAEALAHLGVGSLKLLDFDVVDRSNLNRLVGASAGDVGQPKGEVVGNYVRKISDSTHVKHISGDVTRASAARKLLDCDLIFCCTDGHGSRAVLNQLAYQYLIPVIDLGVRIDATAERITAMAGRIEMLAPGLPCLLCQNLLDAEAVRRDFLTESQRKADPYIVGYNNPQPSIISINMTVASLAVTMLLSVVAAFPAAARHLIYRIEKGIVKPASGVQNSVCIVCSHQGAFARGDHGLMPWVID